ncbi:DUF3883 domain-containing protein [Azospirillum melinis]
MNYRDVMSRKAVLAAIEECDRVGRDTFEARYGYHSAPDFVLLHNGREYDSKAILGVAYRYQFAGLALRNDQFSGSKGGAGRHLARLGFSVTDVKLDPTDWSVQEVTALVQDYFNMLRKELNGEKYSKTKHRNELMTLLNKRERGAVEWKHQNLSAVLNELGLPHISGYKPAEEYQILLAAILEDHIADNPNLFDAAPNIAPVRLANPFVLPPVSTGQGNQTGSRRRNPRLVNFAEFDAANRALGRAGEQWVFEIEQQRLRDVGRPDLAKQVRWVANEFGDGLGYDIESFGDDGRSLYIEVKTTNLSATVPFLISPNEVAASREIGKVYAIYRVFDFAKSPKVYVLRGSVGDTCNLTPASWKAAPKSQTIE